MIRIAFIVMGRDFHHRNNVRKSFTLWLSFTHHRWSADLIWKTNVVGHSFSTYQNGQRIINDFPQDRTVHACVLFLYGLI